MGMFISLIGGRIFDMVGVVLSRMKWIGLRPSVYLRKRNVSLPRVSPRERQSDCSLQGHEEWVSTRVPISQCFGEVKRDFCVRVV